MPTIEFVEKLESLYAQNDVRGILHACSGSNYSDVIELWEKCMTYLYGRTGTHKDWCDENGRPTAEARERSYRVDSAMLKAEEKIPRIIASMRRKLEIQGESP